MSTTEIEAPASLLQPHQVVVIDDLSFSAPKTKDMAAILKALKCQGKSLLVATAAHDPMVYKSARNIEGTNVSLVNTLNVYDILNCNTIVVLKDAVAKIEEVYA